MKQTIKAIPILCAAALSAAVLAAPSAEANPINGSLAFSALGVTVNNSNLADATSFSVSSPYVANDPTGTYSAVPALTPVTFNGFTFNPAVASVSPLWMFDYNGVLYSFDATSVVADYNASREEWDIGGTGVAMATGYTTTEGSWTVNLSQTDASFAFDATAGASGGVPDGGSTMMLLGGGLVCVGGFARRMRG